MLFEEPQRSEDGRVYISSVALKKGVENIVGCDWIPVPASGKDRPEGYSQACAVDCTRQPIYTVI